MDNYDCKKDSQMLKRCENQDMLVSFNQHVVLTFHKTSTE